MNDHLRSLRGVKVENWREVTTVPKLHKHAKRFRIECRTLRVLRASIGLCESFVAQITAAIADAEAASVTGDFYELPKLDTQKTSLVIDWSAMKMTNVTMLRVKRKLLIEAQAEYVLAEAALLRKLRQRRIDTEALRSECQRLTATAFIFSPRYDGALRLWCPLAGYDVEWFRRKIIEKEQQIHQGKYKPLADALRQRMNT